jgi:hypothetical protein
VLWRIAQPISFFVNASGKTLRDFLADTKVKGENPLKYLFVALVAFGGIILSSFGLYYSFLERWKLIEVKASNGDADALNQIGELYYTGWFRKQDYKKSFEYCSLAMKAGNLEAQTRLGWLYEKGRGVDVNYQKAFELYQYAAENGNAAAQEQLARIYENGIGVPRDITEAKRWRLKALNSKWDTVKHDLGLQDN